MSKKEAPKNQDPVEDKDAVLDPSKQAFHLLQATKKENTNFEKTTYFKTPCSSLELNSTLGGGIPTGAHRFLGVSSGGKTSCAFDFMFHFLKEKDRRGVYFKAEGRLSPELQARTGIKFVVNPNDWKEGTCLVVESNIFEVVFGFIKDLITNNPTEANYFFIIDSMDSLLMREGLAKPLTDAGKVAGGAVMTSVFFKKTNQYFAKRGHCIIFVSQVRETVQTDKYAPRIHRQGQSSGGHAIEHGADVVLDFLHRTEKDIIRKGSENDSGEGEDDSKDSGESSSKIKPPPIGHWCRIKCIKTNNEKNGVIVRYPIKYGRVGGKSVWLEFELAEQLIKWEFISKKSSWLTFNPEMLTELRKISPEFPEKIQGINTVRDLLEADSKITDYLYKKFSVLSDI